MCIHTLIVTIYFNVRYNMKTYCLTGLKVCFYLDRLPSDVVIFYRVAKRCLALLVYRKVQAVS